jgi:hypothetical protein
MSKASRLEKELAALGELRRNPRGNLGALGDALAGKSNLVVARAADIDTLRLVRCWW